jgi:hypothetical protein
MNTTTTNPTSSVSRPRQLLSTVRDELRERRQQRATQRSLQRELATYSTRAQVDDLMELLRHQDSAQADHIRGMLNRNLQQPPNRFAS